MPSRTFVEVLSLAGVELPRTGIPTKAGLLVTPSMIIGLKLRARGPAAPAGGFGQGFGPPPAVN